MLSARRDLDDGPSEDLPPAHCLEGGGQREDDYDKLLTRINEEGLPVDAYNWYLDLRRYGTFTHAGFGLGLERTVAWICGLQHIREVIAFPRMMHRLRP